MKKFDVLIQNGRRLQVLFVPGKQRLYIDNDFYALTQQEYALLYLLFSLQGNVVSRADILQKAWHCPATLKTRTIDVHVQRLRKKLGLPLIHTVHGIGYTVPAQCIIQAC